MNIYICINKYILIYLFISIDKHTQTIYKTKVICTCVSKNGRVTHIQIITERENQIEFYDVLCTSIYQEVKHEWIIVNPCLSPASSVTARKPQSPWASKHSRSGVATPRLQPPGFKQEAAVIRDYPSTVMQQGQKLSYKSVCVCCSILIMNQKTGNYFVHVTKLLQYVLPLSSPSRIKTAGSSGEHT